MGGVWQFLDFSHSTKSRRKSSGKGHLGGMEVPRTSIELPQDGRRGGVAMYGNIQFSRSDKQTYRADSSTSSSSIAESSSRPSSASMKSLIDEEISSRPSTSQRTPSVIARLMGMDALPSEAEPLDLSKESQKRTDSRSGVARMMHGSVGPSTYKLQDSMPMKQRSAECYPHGNSAGLKMVRNGTRSSKPKAREHPQEEELQKFKKEFEAWQLNKAWSRPKSIGVDSNSQNGRERQKLAQGRISKEGLLSTVDSGLPNGRIVGLLDNSGSSVCGKPPASKGRMMTPSFGYGQLTTRKYPSIPSQTVGLGSRGKPSGSKLQSVVESGEEDDASPPSTKKIVVLRAGFEDVDDVGITLCCSPVMVEREGSMEAFFEEVKKKLRMEVQGTARCGEASISNRQSSAPLEMPRDRFSLPKAVNQNCIMDRYEASLGYGTPENPPPSRPRDRCSSPVQVEQERNVEAFLAEVKERLRMDMFVGPRQEASTSNQRHSCQGPGDPEQIAQEIAREVMECVSMDLEVATRRLELIDSSRRDGMDLVSGRSRKVEGIDGDPVGFATANGDTILSYADYECSNHGTSTSDQMWKSNWGGDVSLISGKCSSFREGESGGGGGISEELASMSLSRSLSAPISGAVLARLASEDQKLSMDALLQRKETEAGRGASGNAMRSRRDRFNLKGTVSSLKHNFGLRGKLFSRKARPSQESHLPEPDSMHDLAAEQSTLANLGTPLDNLTEVPPSPASISSSMEDFGKPGQPSPNSPLEVPFSEGRSPPQSTKDVSSKNLVAVETTELEEETNQANALDDDEIVEVTDQDEAYIQDVLVRAGLYGRMPADRMLSRWKIMSQPVPISVFEEVEESYNNCEKTDTGNFLSEVAINRRLLFDLLNEALPCLTGPQCISSEDMLRFTSHMMELHGKRLMHDVWKEILNSTQALDEEPFSLDRVIMQDLKMAPWSVPSRDNIGKVVEDVESMVLDQLLDELALESCDLFS